MAGSRVQPNGAAQRLDLACAQRPELTRLQVAELQRADAHALQSLDAAAQLGEHPPHLTLAAFEQDDADQSPRLRVSQEVGAHGARQPVLEEDASAQLLEL